VPLCDRADDRETEARARPTAVSSPEAVKGPVRLIGLQAAALVADAQYRRPVILARADDDLAARRAVPVRVFDEIGERTLERRAVASHRHRAGCKSLDGRIRLRDGPREGVEPHLLDCGLGRLLAGQHEQVVGERREALGIALELLDQLGGLPVTPQVRHVAAQSGQRRAQLVGGIREEGAVRNRAPARGWRASRSASAPTWPPRRPPDARVTGVADRRCARSSRLRRQAH